MSITGEPQVINTVKSSWEILDSPVPLQSKFEGFATEHKSISLPRISNTNIPNRSHCSLYSEGVKSKPLLPLTSTFASLRTESTHDSLEPLEDITNESAISENRQKTPINYSETDEIPLVKADSNISERMKTDSPISIGNKQHNLDTLGDVSREDSSRGAATYVSTQRRRHTEDIAESIANEFEQHVRKSHRIAKKEGSIGEIVQFSNFNNQVLTEETENTNLQRVFNEESTLSRVSESNIELHPESVYGQKSSSSRIDRSSNSDISRVSNPNRHNSETHEGHVSHSTSPASHYSETSNMSDVYLDGHRYGYSNRNVSDRSRYRHPPPEHLRHVETHSRNGHSNRRNQTNDEQNLRPQLNDSNTNHNQQGSLRSSERQPTDDSLHTEREQYEQESRGHESVTDEGRSRPDEVDHPHVPVPVETEESFTRQAMALPNVPPPNFHPPPTIIQNGISQADLLELMSKGLGQFTTEMAVMVIDKLKPEYEVFAKQVGAEVKDSTVVEIKELREKLTVAETELEALKVERDSLKTENSKERDQMKKEFEKDRLKRVKEFEEKKELIDNLQKENEQFKGLLKEKDKMLRKAEMKAKSEEQKRLKSEEESEKKVKEMQKELDKTKGELLVQKSKKRIQISSAQTKKIV